MQANQSPLISTYVSIEAPARQYDLGKFFAGKGSNRRVWTSNFFDQAVLNSQPLVVDNDTPSHLAFNAEVRNHPADPTALNDGKPFECASKLWQIQEFLERQHPGAHGPLLVGAGWKNVFLHLVNGGLFEVLISAGRDEWRVDARFAAKGLLIPAGAQVFLKLPAESTTTP